MPDKPHTQITMPSTSASQEQMNKAANDQSSSPDKVAKKLPPKKKSAKKHKSVLQTKLSKLSMLIGYIGKIIFKTLRKNLILKKNSNIKL
jgi:hypothetical protein